MWLLYLTLILLFVAIVEYHFGVLTYAFRAKGNSLIYMKSMVDRHLSNKQWGLAQMFIAEGVSRYPKVDYFRYMQGLLEYRREHYYKAREAFIEGKAINSDYHDMDNIIGDTYLQLKDYRNAKSTLDYYLLLNPENVNARLNLAIAEYYTENWEGALRLLDQVLLLEPQQIAAYKLMGSIYMKLKRDNDALESFNTYRALGGNDPQVHSQIMRIYRNMEDYESCRSYAESLLSQGHDEPSYYTHLGDALCHLGKVGKGVAMLNQAVQLDAHQSEAHYLLAKLMALMHHKSEALDHLKQAIADYPRYRVMAIEDEDFNNLRFFRDFYRLVGERGM